MKSPEHRLLACYWALAPGFLPDACKGLSVAAFLQMRNTSRTILEGPGFKRDDGTNRRHLAFSRGRFQVGYVTRIVNVA